MMLKLAALGSLGYVAYKMYEKEKRVRESNLNAAVPGGRLSDKANVVPPTAAEVWPTAQP